MMAEHVHGSSDARAGWGSLSGTAAASAQVHHASDWLVAVALVLLNTFPRMDCPDPYPVGATAEVNDQFAVMLESVSTTRVRFGKAS